MTSLLQILFSIILLISYGPLIIFVLRSYSIRPSINSELYSFRKLWMSLRSRSINKCKNGLRWQCWNANQSIKNYCSPRHTWAKSTIILTRIYIFTTLQSHDIMSDLYKRAQCTHNARSLRTSPLLNTD